MSIIIPRSVEMIASSCFYDCKSLSSVSIESDSFLRRIESEAFALAKLRSGYLPESVRSIGWNTFPDSCKISRGWGIVVLIFALIGFNKREKKEPHGK
jgi:hypothetical protein